jgi:hypothetical protein
MLCRSTIVHSTPIPAKAQPPVATSRGRPISNETGRYPANVPTAAQPGSFVIIYYSNFIDMVQSIISHI